MTNTPSTQNLIAEDTARMQAEDFIQRIAPIAQEMQKQNGILPSIILAQAALESDFGNSLLASKYHNLFGVKAFGHSQSVNLDTKEFIDGQWITYSGEFRVYNSWRESIEAHSALMENGVTWNAQLYHGVINARNYVEAANALQDAGYATDPTYAQKLIQMIEQHNLTRFD
ncbi:MAG: glycoside hydrolase family 73 protein [Streptococcaceae bacterium]|nr:glycoside hydrolase family 73 protein [Streptococcaceae bacterium]